MESTPLGERIRELRLESGISLRKLAEMVRKSPPFISDIELGRRFPSVPVLKEIATALGVEFEELRKYDARESMSRLKELARKDAGWSFALRTAAEEASKGNLSAEEFLKRLKGSATD
jgi:transcriptional regulator with XRE-family HTH domain